MPTQLIRKPNVSIGDTITQDGQNYKAIRLHSSGTSLKNRDTYFMFTEKGALELEKVE